MEVTSEHEAENPPAAEEERPAVKVVKEEGAGSSIMTESMILTTQKPVVFESLELRSVSYQYDNATRKAVNQVCFTIRKGQFVALIGRSGCGKSTLMDILLRFKKEQTGSIMLYGLTNFSTFTDTEARSLSGVVFQEAHFINGTVWDNLTMGISAISHEACRR